MKLRGFIISGLLLAVMGVLIIVIAVTRSDFKKSVIDSNITTEELVYSASEVQNITFEANVENLIVKQSENGEIKIISKSSEYFNYEFNKNDETKTLTIKQNEDDSWFRFDLLGLIGKTDVKYEIYLPKGMIKDLNIDIDTGNVVIENQEFDELNVSVDAGNVELKKVNALTGVIYADVGNVDIDNSVFGTIKAQADVGNVSAHTSVTVYGLFVVDVGNVNVELIGKQGDYNVNGNNQGNISIDIQVDVGNEDYKVVNA